MGKTYGLLYISIKLYFKKLDPQLHYQYGQWKLLQDQAFKKNWSVSCDSFSKYLLSSIMY